MGMGKTWGPSTWYILHTLSLTWEESLVPFYIRFITLMSRTVPCIKCRRHFNRNIRRSGGIAKNCQSKERMIRWIVDLHNIVNKRNRKKVYSYEKAQRIYYKNGNLIYRRSLLITFMREYITYNFRFARGKSIRMMHILGHIFPFKGRRERFRKYLKNKKIKNMGLMRWLKGYKKIL